MSKPRKQDLINAINKADLLDAELEQIKKTTNPAIKKATLNKFIQAATAYIDDERDVLLIAVKIR